MCRFCGSGCETRVGLRYGKVVKVEGLQEGWNRGRLCIKGLLNREILYVSDRAHYPMVRKNGQLVRVSWDEALDAAAAGFREAIAQGGPDAVAFYGSGQLFTQESYTANKVVQGRHRDEQRRWQPSPVHGLGGVRLQVRVRRG
ncbi:molybdopterin-dependent oxidoreductase [Archangium violaceum]|uniref:molybdopterin-dependent oxidoreductase n=1 Tax=Archangium violaceum TaxID=83451 RepID=UPI00193BC88B|nr:molybdopterin-dependent oxidoreductase [Archangium violaceum]